MKNWVLLSGLGLLVTGAVAASPASQASHSHQKAPTLEVPIDHRLGGVETSYSQWTRDLAKKWPVKGFSTELPEGSPIRLKAYTTPGNPLYIGLEQFMIIKAPLATVEKIMDDVDSYRLLFPGYEETKRTSVDRNLWVTFWEQSVPLPFVPNVKYEILYVVHKPTPQRKIYRYQLHKETTLRKSDGIIILEERAPGETAYIEFDFFDADWGPAKIAGENSLWKDSVAGLFLSDVAVKLKAEDPSLPYEKARWRAKDALEKHPVEAVVKARQPWKPL